MTYTSVSIVSIMALVIAWAIYTTPTADKAPEAKAEPEDDPEGEATPPVQTAKIYPFPAARRQEQSTHEPWTPSHSTDKPDQSGSL